MFFPSKKYARCKKCSKVWVFETSNTGGITFQCRNCGFYNKSRPFIKRSNYPMAPEKTTVSNEFRIGTSGIEYSHKREEEERG